MTTRGSTVALACLACALPRLFARGATKPNADDPHSIQAAIDARPGRPLYLPAGEYRIDAPIVLSTSGSGLFGEGTIIQTNDDADIVQVRDAGHVRSVGHRDEHWRLWNDDPTETSPVGIKAGTGPLAANPALSRPHLPRKHHPRPRAGRDSCGRQTHGAAAALQMGDLVRR